MGLRVIVTGASGMVGEGVLQECLANAAVDVVLAIGRSSCGYSDPKLSERIVKDLADIRSLRDEVASYDACFFCMGVSSIGMPPEDYYRITHDLTLSFAQTIAEARPSMTLCYVSGKSTDSSENGRVRWARVKGKTENDLFALLPNAYGFRPGMLQPRKDAKHVLRYYKYVAWLVPLMVKLAPKSASTLSDLGRSMISVALNGYPKKTLEVVDIRMTAAV